ncbi:hypothetical protein BH20ACT4_BH20ACT4_00160 [soil metagenome]
MSERSERTEGRASERQLAARRWGVGAQPPRWTVSERSERMDGRASARSPLVDGVWGRSPHGMK